MFDTQAKVPVYRSTHRGRDFAFMVTVSATKGNEYHLMPADLESIARAKAILCTEDDVLLPFSHSPSAEQLTAAVDSILGKIKSIPLLVLVSRTVEGAELTMNTFAELKDIKLLKED